MSNTVKDKIGFIDEVISKASVRLCSNYCEIFAEKVKQETNVEYKNTLESNS